MSVQNFIPKVWSARLLSHLNKAQVYASELVSNRDYEGEISQYGDTVHINRVEDVTIRDYVPNTDIAAPEELDGSQRSLVIDQMKYFNFAVDDVDRRQGHPDYMDQAMERASYGLRDAADRYVASLYTEADSNNLIGSDADPVTISEAAMAYEVLVDLAVKLDNANVPQEGRWVVVPPWFHGLMLKDNRFVTYTAQGDATRANGQVGEAAGFRILKSNNVPKVAGDGSATFDNEKIIAGYTGAITFAEQILKIEAYRPDNRFSDAVKGLYVYGAKVIRPEGIAVLSAVAG